MLPTLEFTGADEFEGSWLRLRTQPLPAGSEAGDWAFWLGDKFKLVRLLGITVSR
jgi:hypothetical protein